MRQKQSPIGWVWQAVGGLVGLAGLVAAGFAAATFFQVPPEVDIRLEQASVDGSRINLVLRNRGRDNGHVSRAEFVITEHSAGPVPAMLMADSGPINPTEVTFKAEFPVAVTAGNNFMVSVPLGYEVAGSDVGSFSVEVSVPPVSTKREQREHRYVATATLFYNATNTPVTVGPITVSAVTPRKVTVTPDPPDRPDVNTPTTERCPKIRNPKTGQLIRDHRRNCGRD